MKCRLHYSLQATMLYTVTLSLAITATFLTGQYSVLCHDHQHFEENTLPMVYTDQPMNLVLYPTTGNKITINSDYI